MNRPDKQWLIIKSVMELGCQFIGLVETMKHDYSDTWRRGISGPRTFHWQHVPPVGRFGGLLLGVNNDSFSVINSELGAHFIRFLIQDKVSRKLWNLAVIYDPAQINHKEEFLA